MPGVFPRYAQRVHTQITPTEGTEEEPFAWVALFSSPVVFFAGWPTASAQSRMVLGRFGVPVLRPIG